MTPTRPSRNWRAGRSDEISGLTPHECLIEPIADCLETNLRICLETESSLQYERELDLPDGRLAWKTTLIPTARQAGEPLHVVGMTRDISYEARMASVAEHHEALLKGLGSTLPNVIYLYDLKTQRVCFTAGADSRPLGYRPQQFIEMGNELVPLLVHPDDQARVAEHLKDLARLEDGEISSIEYRVRHLDGRYRHFHSRETVFNRDDAGEVELILGVSEDVTEQDRMQEEVRDLSERLLMLQIEERRVIAQELHDSTAQHLIAADLALERIREVARRRQRRAGRQPASSRPRSTMRSSRFRRRSGRSGSRPSCSTRRCSRAAALATRSRLRYRLRGPRRPRDRGAYRSARGSGLRRVRRGPVPGLPGGADQRLPPRPRQQGRRQPRARRRGIEPDRAR